MKSSGVNVPGTQWPTRWPPESALDARATTLGSGILPLIELLLVIGVVMWFGVSQLRALKRSKIELEKKKRAKEAAKRSDNDHKGD